MDLEQHIRPFLNGNWVTLGKSLSLTGKSVGVW